jgi:hypothetical protein
MKKDRTKFIIGILMTLMLFSSFVALWEYAQNKELQQKKKKFVHVYVLTHDVEKNHQLTPRDITLKEFPRDVVSWRVLKQNQILHKYTKVPLYKGEPLLASKLQNHPLKIQKKEKKTTDTKKAKKDPLAPQKDLITLPVKMFKNIDTTLYSGAYVDIVSVDPLESKDRSSKNFKTKYVAICVKVASFSSHGKTATNILEITNYKEKGKQHTKEELADMINLEVTPKNINNLLYLYYKTQPLNAKRFFNNNQDFSGHLWLVRCADPTNKKMLKEKEQFLLQFEKPKKVRKIKRQTSGVRIDYEN